MGGVDDDRSYPADADAEQPGRAVVAVAEERPALVLGYLDVAGAHADEERERLHFLRRHLGGSRYQRFRHVAADHAQVRVQRAEREAVTVRVAEGTQWRHRLRRGQAQLNQGSRIGCGFSDTQFQAVRGDHLLDGQHPGQVDPLDSPRDVGEGGVDFGMASDLVKERPVSCDNGSPMTVAWALEHGRARVRDQLVDGREIILGHGVPAEQLVDRILRRERTDHTRAERWAMGSPCTRDSGTLACAREASVMSLSPSNIGTAGSGYSGTVAASRESNAVQCV